jgi:starch-binding outer membrane protein, SusD/RagB family
MRTLTIKYMALGWALALLFSSCKKFVDADVPDNELTAATVFTTDETALGAMTGLYSTMTSNTLLLAAYSSMPALSADELQNYSTDAETVQLYSNSIALSGNTTDFLWTRAYQLIYMANAAIEGARQSTTLSAPVANQVIGEGEFMRAFFYFNLVNEYGGVPLVTTTNYVTNSSIARSTVQAVYTQIISDLQDAQSKLTDNYLDGTNAVSSYRIRPNKGAATALLARAYLYTGNWAAADSSATVVIDNTGQYSLDSLNSVFLANSTEAIFQLQPAGIGGLNTPEGFWYILYADPSISSNATGGKIATISSGLLNAFEPGDNRAVDWVGSFTDNTTTPATTYYFPYKYKIGNYGNASVTEYSMVLRLAEQYLIRAEAEIEEGQTAAGIADLNVLRSRARGAATPAIPNPLPPLNAGLSNAGAMAALVQERRIELFSEFGHRWYDLKRLPGLSNPSGKLADEVMPAATAAKGGTWNDQWELYPVPLTDMQTNPSLVQNPGYQQ